MFNKFQQTHKTVKLSYGRNPIKRVANLVQVRPDKPESQHGDPGQNNDREQITSGIKRQKLTRQAMEATTKSDGPERQTTEGNHPDSDKNPYREHGPSGQPFRCPNEQAASDVVKSVNQMLQDDKVNEQMYISLQQDYNPRRHQEYNNLTAKQHRRDCVFKAHFSHEENRAAMKQYLRTNTFQERQAGKGEAVTLIMDYISAAEDYDCLIKLPDFTRQTGETITEAMRRYLALMEPIGHELAPELWPKFREKETIKALKHVVSPSTRQHITSMETGINMIGFHADSYIRAAEEHENSLTRGQRGTNGGHPDKLQVPSASQTETTPIIPESPKKTKDSLSGTDPEAKGSTRQPCLTPPDSGKPELRRSPTPSGTGSDTRGPTGLVNLTPSDLEQHESRINPILSGTDPDTKGPARFLGLMPQDLGQHGSRKSPKLSNTDQDIRGPKPTTGHSVPAPQQERPVNKITTRSHGANTQFTKNHLKRNSHRRKSYRKRNGAPRNHTEETTLAQRHQCKMPHPIGTPKTPKDPAQWGSRENQSLPKADRSTQRPIKPGTPSPSGFRHTQIETQTNLKQHIHPSQKEGEQTQRDPKGSTRNSNGKRQRDGTRIDYQDPSRHMVRTPAACCHRWDRTYPIGPHDAPKRRLRDLRLPPEFKRVLTGT